MRRAISFLSMTVFLFFFSASPIFPSSGDEIKVEGIAYDDRNPEGSVAVVDGNLVRKGDRYDGFQVLSVERDSVQLMDEQTGAQSRVTITGGDRREEAKSLEKPARENKPDRQGEQGRTERGGDTLSQVMNTLKQLTQGEKPAGSHKGKERNARGGDSSASWNPLSWLLSLCWEVVAIMEIRTVYTAAAAYYLKVGHHASGPEDLVREKLLSKEFENGLHGKYRFTIRSSTDHIEIHADPAESPMGLKHFYIDEDGTIRVAKDKPATSDSPAISPANILGWSP